MNALFTKLFECHQDDPNITYKKIAKTIKVAIVNESLPHGSYLPRAVTLAKHLKISVKIVLDAYHDLERKEQLSKESVEKNTFRVSAANANPASLIPVPNKRQYDFDSFRLEVTTRESKGLQAAFRKYTAGYYNLQAWKKRTDVMPHSLSSHLRATVNGATSANYSLKELLYSADEKHMMHSIVAATVSSRNIIVLPNYTPAVVAEVIKASDKRIQWVGSDEGGNWLNELEAICLKEKKVSIFYMSSRSAYPFNYQMKGEVVKQLLLLQQRFKFTIVEDDRYAASREKSINEFMYGLYNEDLNIIYIRPLSQFFGEPGEVSIAAGPRRIINKVRDKLNNFSKVMSKDLAYSLGLMMDRGKLQKFELTTNTSMRSACRVARKLLAASGLWKEEEDPSQGMWSFYLEPLEGTFPDNVHHLLSEAGFNVINPEDYIRKSKIKPGVVIAIAGYHKLEDRLHKDLALLITFLKSTIIY